MKKVLALLVAIIMVLSMGVVAFADDDPVNPPAGGDDPIVTPGEDEEEEETPAYDHPLTVTGLMTGDTVKFYKVIEWVGDAEGNVGGWAAVSTYASVLDEDTLNAVLVGDPNADPKVEPTGITSELAGQLAALASGGVDGVIDGTTATLDNASEGMWMALITPADANTLYNPVFVSADYMDDSQGTIATSASLADSVAKKSTLTLTKTAENENDYNEDNADTTAVGDVVTFTVNTTIPGYGDVYEHPHFVLTDSLTALELKTDTVNLTAPTGLKKKGAEGVEDADADYEVEATSSGYTITFTEKYLKTVKTATGVTVTYDAEVTSDAANAINEEQNEVTIEYSHNPNEQSDYDIKKDTTQHYTFSLDAEGLGLGADETVNGKKTSEIVKVGRDAAGNPITETTEHSEIVGSETQTWTSPLAGAEFGLWKSDDANCEGDPYKTATTGDDGRMNFAGLDAGTYYLKEIKAPTGFVTSTTIVPVVITAELEPVTVTETIGDKTVTYETEILKSYTVKVNGEDTATYTFKNDTENPISSTDINWEEAEIVELPFDFPNTQGTQLPSTGGIGTTIFYVAGSILVLAAAVLLITKRRMGAND